MTQSDLNPYLKDPSALPRFTVLLKEQGVRAVLLHLKAGEQIPEHHTPGALIIQSVLGRVNFVTSDADVELTPGSLISLHPGNPHRVAAVEESLLLLTMSEQSA